MPKVGKQHYPYTKAGYKAAEKAREKLQVGGPVVNAMERSETYQAGGETWASRLKKSLKPISVDEYNKQSGKRKADQKAKQEARVAKRKKVVGKVKKVLKPQTVKEYKAGEGERRAKSKAKQKKRKAVYSKVAGVIKKGLTPKPVEKKKTKKKKGAVKRSKYSGHIS